MLLPGRFPQRFNRRMSRGTDLGGSPRAEIRAHLPERRNRMAGSRSGRDASAAIWSLPKPPLLMPGTSHRAPGTPCQLCRRVLVDRMDMRRAPASVLEATLRTARSDRSRSIASVGLASAAILGTRALDEGSSMHVPCRRGSDAERTGAAGAASLGSHRFAICPGEEHWAECLLRGGCPIEEDARTCRTSRRTSSGPSRRVMRSECLKDRRGFRVRRSGEAAGDLLVHRGVGRQGAHPVGER